MITYKLFQVMKNGDIKPVFINKLKALPLNKMGYKNIK